MAAATIRLGKISSINYTAGKARVVYEDRDDSVTSNPVEQTPTGSFLLPKWGRFGSQRKSRGNDYPCGKIKIL